uniref:Target of rapamycin complex subunit lst8 n=1 Tax=Heterorhabditis bacteriophora TaxID=37862 RepID=A0A1I7WFU1_HETBA
MALTPNGCQLAVGSYQKVRIYDMTTLKSPNCTNPVSVCEHIMKNVTAIGFEAQSRWMFTGGEDHSCRVYEMRGNQLVCQRIFEVDLFFTLIILGLLFVSYIFPFCSVETTEDRLKAFITIIFLIFLSIINPIYIQGLVYVWDLRRESNEQLPMPTLSYQEFVVKLSVHPSGQILAGITNRGNLITWDLSSGGDEWAQVIIDRQTETCARLRGEGNRSIYKAYGLSCRYSPDGRSLVTTSSNNMVIILNAHDNSVRKTIDAGSDWNWDASFTCDSRLVVVSKIYAFFINCMLVFTGGSDNRVKLWDVDSGQLLTRYEGHTKPITAICSTDNPLI